MVEAEVLLKCCIFIDIVDSANKFSLVSRYNSIDIILLVERINGMNLSHQLFPYKFKASLENVFDLPCVKKKMLTKLVDNDHGENFYQYIKLKIFQRGRPQCYMLPTKKYFHYSGRIPV